MQLDWKQSESTQKPPEIDATSTASGVYLRRNITETETDGVVKYTYDEVLLPPEFKYDITDPEQYKAKLLQDFKTRVLAQNEMLYNAALNKPLPYGVYFLLAEWVTTYNNALSTAQRKEARGIVEPFNIAVLSPTGLQNISIATVNEFLPMFDIVSDEWARLIDKRNQYLVDIQNTQTLDALEAIEITY